MQTIQNKKLKISVNEFGAALTSISSLKNNKEYLWRGDDAFWGGQAPILFPFVGRLKNDTFIAKGKEYSQKQHGFFRKSNETKLIDQTDSTLTYSIKHSKATLEVYPYEFEFITQYEIVGTKINILHKVTNLGNQTMYFSLGEHPAFNCSLIDPNKSYEDCALIFSENETDVTWNLSDEGLFDTTTTNILADTNKIDLNQKSFENDALVFKNLKSKTITLKNKNEGPLVTLRYDDFPLLGIWSKQDAPFVCIEPWIGCADSINSSQKIEEKEGIIPLDSNQTFEASYSIEIHD